MSNGKSFERLVHIIQEALKNNQLTTVHLDKRIQSRTGQLRQFDVIIDSSVNGYNIRVAIECKDHGRKVESSAIEAFHTKCDLVGGIHRRIFISNAGFQKGAIASAKLLDIELHILNDGLGNKIVEWLDPDEFYRCKFYRQVNRADITIEGEDKEMPPFTIKGSDIIYYTDGQSSTYANFIEWVLSDKEFQRRVMNMMMSFLPHFQAQGTLNEEKPINMRFSLGRYAYFKINEKEVFIREVDFDLGIYIRMEKSAPDVKILHNPSGDNVKAGVFSVPQDNEGSKFQVVVDPNSDKFKAFITNPDGSIKYELKTFAKYNPKTQQYEKPDEDE